MAGDRRIGFVRQPELAQAGAAVAAAARFIRARQRQEFVEGRLRFTARQIDGDGVADQRPAGAEDGERHALSRRLAEQPFLGRAAQPAKRRPLRERQPHGGADPGDLALDDRGEREIEVVAAEEQVIADRHALERRRTRFDADPDQAEIGGAAADVADECNLFVFERDRPPLFGHPRVERGDRFLQQRQRRHPRRPRRLDGQLACLLVKRCRDGEHDRLPFERRRLVSGCDRRVPGVAQVHQIARRRIDRRHPRGRAAAARWKEGCVPIDPGMGQPRFRG